MQKNILVGCKVDYDYREYTDNNYILQSGRGIILGMLFKNDDYLIVLREDKKVATIASNHCVVIQEDYDWIIKNRHKFMKKVSREELIDMDKE